MWKMLLYSRVAERIQLRPTKTFRARGERELQLKLEKIPWHCYLPIKEYNDYRFPFINAKTHNSNLYHTRKVTDVAKMVINDLPYQLLYRTSKKEVGYLRFRRDMRAKM